MFSKASLEMKPSTELSEFNLLNSELDTDMMLDNLCLTVEMLKVHSGSEHLDDVKSLEICVDTRQDTLDNFGIHLPKLTDLKMNNSFISSIRDLGTSLSHLQILRLARCSLTDLEGISALTSLKELYVAYNSISELSPVSMLENLELLDLEGNDVEDLAQLWYLGCCGKLRALSMEGNPVCTNPAPGQSESSDYSFRSAVRELVPQLSFLDDVPVEEDKPHDGRTSLLDWTILKESIKDSSVSERLHAIDTDTEVRSVVCGARPSSAQSMDLRKTFNSPSNSRPHTSCGGSRPGSAGSELPMLNHETMDLTIGVGSVLCGNPIQAVRERRKKNKLHNTPPPSRPSSQVSSYIPKHNNDFETPTALDCRDIFAELRSWRIEHKHPLAFDDEGSHSHGVSSDDDSRDRSSCRGTSSPESSVQSPLPESPVTPPFTSSSASMSPSPPPNVPSTGRRITQIRTKRLKPYNTVFNTPSPLERSTNISPQAIHKPHRPSANPEIFPRRVQCLETNGSHQH